MGAIQAAVPGDLGNVPSCATCGSQRVVKDAWACWNVETGLWELEKEFDQAFCQQCESKTTLVWKHDEAKARERIRALNDTFRTHGRGQGSIMVTPGIQALGGQFTSATIAAVRAFDQFCEDNDPWGEHDFGAVDIEDQKVFWKIDYLSLDMTAGSENPANEGITHRVLTIMLAQEY